MEMTWLKKLSSQGMSSASPTTNIICARSTWRWRARRIISSATSMPTTCPWGALSARMPQSQPAPQPRSRILSVGAKRISASMPAAMAACSSPISSPRPASAQRLNSSRSRASAWSSSSSFIVSLLPLPARTQAAEVVHQVPDLLLGMNPAEAGHAGEADAVADDDEKLGVRVGLHAPRVEPHRARVERGADFRGRAAVGPVAEGAVGPELHGAVGDAQRVVLL